MDNLEKVHDAFGWSTVASVKGLDAIYACIGSFKKNLVFSFNFLCQHATKVDVGE